MFKNERNKRLFHIVSNLFIAGIWTWLLYVQSQIDYPTTLESNFQKAYMFILVTFIIATIVRIGYHFFKLKKYTAAKNAKKLSKSH
ncbi:hypothetical protein ACEN4P_05525 [Marinilactibacillus psychrotolerans]|uniref:Uncharacterized protein n=1 Tax=Marinilactibacillus psychrotolerans TaxID=191770 RepID=A0A511H2J4_9LACT|nr:hypothetical protein [Marinilactibacillus psychrotolerans]TLQ06730.1 hypothetical protein FEZ48_08990 [Marinilactibacillus psychrotolerans]SDC69729.1 hypothetical protein SAMN04488013_10847 [Marinilactibacillus psychrotolerans]GEL67735.1 hypothetical protein MPS01_18900 [Marinilactibacillus psychrotolerans]GEQ32362.1 hypothetical protein B795N_02440 [Marinilactibacillus psychrotolerans]GEQ35595.1 hypothetical protein M132T_11030 [Marinilactibacillus psychrotolerans]